MNAHGGFDDVRSNFDETKPEVRISVDRLKAADLGISLDQIGTTLQVMFGSREAGTFTVAGPGIQGHRPGAGVTTGALRTISPTSSCARALPTS